MSVEFDRLKMKVAMATETIAHLHELAVSRSDEIARKDAEISALRAASSPAPVVAVSEVDPSEYDALSALIDAAVSPVAIPVSASTASDPASAETVTYPGNDHPALI